MLRGIEQVVEQLEASLVLVGLRVVRVLDLDDYVLREFVLATGIQHEVRPHVLQGEVLVQQFDGGLRVVVQLRLVHLVGHAGLVLLLYRAVSEVEARLVHVASHIENEVADGLQLVIHGIGGNDSLDYIICH